MNEKKRVAFFGIKYFPSRGGTSRVAESLIRELKNQYDLSIYCYDHQESITNIPGVKVITFKEPRIKGIGVLLFFFKCFIHLMTKGNYDLVHIHKTEAAFFAPLIRLRFPTIATSHALPYLVDKWTVLGRSFLKFAEWVFIHSGATLTSISQEHTQYYTDKYQVPITFIPNGIVKPVLGSEEELSKFLKKHNVPNNFILFAARRMVSSKGCHHLLKALHKINFTGHLVVAGDMKQRPQYSNLLVKSAKGLNVSFVGYIESSKLLNSLTKAARLFVFPSEIEGMSMMLLEVISLGTGIIASDIAPNKLIFDKDVILYFKSADTDDLAHKLSWALDNPSKMAEMSQEARDYVERNYTMAAIASQYSDLYDKTMAVT